MKAISVLFLSFLLFSCDKPNLNKVCDVDDPLTELSWLAEFDEEMDPRGISKVILLDKRSDKKKKLEGFFIEEGNIWSFYNCQGEALCIGGGFAGAQCPDFEILESVKLK